MCEPPWPTTTPCFGHGIPITLNISLTSPHIVLTSVEYDLLANRGWECICRCDENWRSIGDLVGGYCHVHSPTVWSLWFLMGMVVLAHFFHCIRSLAAYYRHLSSMRIKMINGVPISGLVAAAAAVGAGGRGDGELVSRSGGHDRQRSKLAIGQAMAMNNPGQAVEVSIGGSPHSVIHNNANASTPINNNGASAAAANAVMAAAAASTAASNNQTFRGGSPSVVVHTTNADASPSPKRHPASGVAQSSPAQPLRASLVGGSPTGPTSLPGTPLGAGPHAAFGGGGILPPPAAVPSNGLPPSPAAAAAPLTPTAVQIAAAIAQNARVPTMWSLPQIRYLTMATVFGCGYGALVLSKIWYMYDPFNIAYDLPPTLAYWFGATFFALCAAMHSWRIVVVSESIAADHSLSATLVAMKQLMIFGLSINFVSFILLVLPIYITERGGEDRGRNRSQHSYYGDLVQETCIMLHFIIKNIAMVLLGPVVHRRHANQVLKLLEQTNLTGHQARSKKDIAGAASNGNGANGTPKSKNGTIVVASSPIAGGIDRKASLVSGNGAAVTAAVAAASSDPTEELTPIQLQRRDLVTSLKAMSVQATKGAIIQISILTVLCFWPWFRLMGAYVVPVMLSQGTYVILLAVRVLPKPSSALKPAMAVAANGGKGGTVNVSGDKNKHHGREPSHTHDTRASQMINRVVPLRPGAVVASVPSANNRGGGGVLVSPVHSPVTHHHQLVIQPADTTGGRNPSPLPAADSHSPHGSPAHSVAAPTVTATGNTTTGGTTTNVTSRSRLMGTSHRSYSPVNDPPTTIASNGSHSNGGNGNGGSDGLMVTTGSAASTTALALLQAPHSHLEVSPASGHSPTAVPSPLSIHSHNGTGGASNPSTLALGTSSYHHARGSSADRHRISTNFPPGSPHGLGTAAGTTNAGTSSGRSSFIGMAPTKDGQGGLIHGSPPAKLRVFNSFSDRHNNNGSNISEAEDEEGADIVSSPVIEPLSASGGPARRFTAGSTTPLSSLPPPQPLPPPLLAGGVLPRGGNSHGGSDGFIMDMTTPMAPPSHLGTFPPPLHPTTSGNSNNGLTVPAPSSDLTINANAALTTGSNSGTSSPAGGSPSFQPLGSSRNRLAVSTRPPNNGNSPNGGNGDHTARQQQISPVPTIPGTVE